MRGSAWLVISVLALLAVGCSPKPRTAAAPPAAAPVAAPAPTPAVAAPATPPAAEPTPVAAPEPPPPPATAEPVRFSRADYGARERRLSALIANAQTRDTTGETEYRANEGRGQRQRCATKACIERSYAVEEAWMRKWEGSDDVK
ncbi:MAG TPA: hypothetical protein VGN89_02100 [Phenylobacterium sp.]|nr:hypothetical protein [Phenylobacterium sp.]